MKSYQITPVPASRARVTKNGTYTPKRYANFKSDCRKIGMLVPSFMPILIFQIAMPRSWSQNKKAKMRHRIHQQKPDIDNLIKAVLDACLVDDALVGATLSISVWSAESAITIGDARSQLDRMQFEQVLVRALQAQEQQ